MCKAMEDMRNTAWNEGKIEGIKENAIETAKSLINMGLLTFEQIAQATKLSIDQIKELASA